MKFSLSVDIEMDNAAFEDGNGGRAELVSCLERVIARLKNGGATSGPVKDLNGNTVGAWSIDEDADE